MRGVTCMFRDGVRYVVLAHPSDRLVQIVNHLASSLSPDSSQNSQTPEHTLLFETITGLPASTILGQIAHHYHDICSHNNETLRSLIPACTIATALKTPMVYNNTPLSVIMPLTAPVIYGIENLRPHRSPCHQALNQYSCRLREQSWTPSSTSVRLLNKSHPLALELPGTLPAPQRSRHSLTAELDRLREHVVHSCRETPVLEEMNVPEAASSERETSTVRVSSPPAERHLGINVGIFDVNAQYSGFWHELETAPDLVGLVVDAQEDAEVVGIVGILL